MIMCLAVSIITFMMMMKREPYCNIFDIISAVLYNFYNIMHVHCTYRFIHKTNNDLTHHERHTHTASFLSLII